MGTSTKTARKGNVKGIKLLKILSNPQRVRILSALDVKNLNATQLASKLNIPMSNLRTMLRALRDANMINCERSGRVITYSLTSKSPLELVTQATELSNTLSA